VLIAVNDKLLVFVHVHGDNSADVCMQVSASGVFQLEVGPWKNELGVTADGRCCEATSVNSSECPAACQTFLRVCLSHYQAVIPDRPDCTYGSVLTDADQFTDSLQRSKVEIPFEFAWPVIILSTY